MVLFVMRYCPVSLVLLYSFVVSEVSPFSDEGWEQKEKLLDENILKEVFLETLGLSRIPNVSRAKITESEMEEMTALYERSLREDDNVNPAYSSDFQRLYTFKDKAPKTEKRDVHLLSFHLNIESTARVMSVYSAKLYIYKKERRGIRSAVLELYQLIESSMLDDPQSLLIESRRVEFGYDEWEEFDVTETVATWFEKPSSNHGFLIKCKQCTRRRMILVTADTDRDSDKRARLDVSVGASSLGIKKRSGTFAIESEEEEEEEPIFNNCTERGENNNLCCRYSLWLSFKEMSWDWVLQPEGFHAYYCKGKCTHDYLNYASTHAMLQSIVNWKHDKSIPRPCCVPKTLKPLKLLHYTDSDPPQLIVTKQTGMIAESCGCA